jgi:hypothetical protein
VIQGAIPQDIEGTWFRSIPDPAYPPMRAEDAGLRRRLPRPLQPQVAPPILSGPVGAGFNELVRVEVKSGRPSVAGRLRVRAARRLSASDSEPPGD